VRRADRDGQRVELRGFHEVSGFVRIGQQHLARHQPVRAVAVLLVALHRLQRPQASELAFHGDADLVRHRHDLSW
jgi:hypothetical protein